MHTSRVRGVGAAAIAVVVLTFGLTALGASAAERQEVSFTFGLGLFDGTVTSTERGNNLVVVEWPPFLGLSSAGLFCCEAVGELTWKWNVKLQEGHVSGPVATNHFFDPVVWEGELRGRVTASGGEGTLHMTERFTGMKLRARWTSPSVDPTVDVSIHFVVTGTVIG